MYLVIITYTILANDVFQFQTLETAQEVMNKLKSNGSEVALELWATAGQHKMKLIERVDKR